MHAHDWVTAHAATVLKEALALPLVATMHATEAGRHQGWLPGPLSRAIHTTEWWLTYEARRVITCSAHMQTEVTRLFDLPTGTVDVIANGVDVERWRVPASATAAVRSSYVGGGPLLVFAGRLEWEKGLHTLLEAMPGLRRAFPGLRLVVAGQGTYEHELRALTKQRRLGRAVEFAGFLDQPELAALVRAADVAVVPSIYEPFGLAALEAAAAGTPLVVSSTGGLAEFVTDGSTGLRFTPGDPVELAAAVRTLLVDEVLGRRLARTARRALAERYSWDAAAARTVEVYRDAVAQERDLQDSLASSNAPHARPLQMVVRDGNLLSGDS